MTITAIDTASSLGGLVSAHPELARELERRGLDYCCGGGRSLDDACRAVGLDAAEVAADLAGLVDPGAVAPDWASMDAVALVEHLVATHHRYLWDEMPRLSALTARIAGVHGGRHPELHEVAATYEALRADMEPHLLKEERVLFPMVRDLAAATSAPSFHCGTLRNPIGVMRHEHDVVGDLLARLRELTAGYAVPADGCASYTACYAALEQLEADTHLHVHKENNVLFPMVERMEDARAVAGGTA